jgi:AcrR family transcriptional regulator
MRQRIPDAERRKQIIERSRTIFQTRGVSALSMDEIASLQGISKKTLYKFFPNKAALTEATIEERIQEIAASLEKIVCNSALPFLAQLRGIFGIVSRQIAEVGESFMKDIYYHEPELWELIDKFRRERVFGIVTKLLEAGMKDGFIRNDIDGRLMPLLFVNAVSSVMTPAQFVKLPFPPAELFDAFIRILFVGVLSEKGRRRFFSQEEEK